MGRKQLTPQSGKLSGGANSEAVVRPAEMAARMIEVFIFGEVDDWVMMSLSLPAEDCKNLLFLKNGCSKSVQEKKVEYVVV